MKIERKDFGQEIKPQTLTPRPYYASFIPGLQSLIADVLHERLTDVKIHKLLDGAVLFETHVSYDKLNFFCFNNIFAVIDVKTLRSSAFSALKNKNISNIDYLECHIDNVIKNSTKNEVIAKNSPKFKTFRMVFSNENTPVSINEKLKIEIEKYITKLSGLKVNRSKPDTEFWFLYRKEKEQNDFCVFMKRLTLRSSWEKTLHKGELPPPLAWSLCRLAELKHSDTVLDPFCGYGSIPEAALKYFHTNKFIACDNNKEAASFTKARFKKKVSAIKTSSIYRKKDNFVFYQNDFSELPSIIGENSIDVIITDPPWGHFSEIDSGSFYKKMFEVFSAILKEGGRAVVLCANKDGLLTGISADFALQDSFQILLSGKKAVIFRFFKNSKH